MLLAVPVAAQDSSTNVTTNQTTNVAFSRSLVDDVIADADKSLYLRYGVFVNAARNYHTANFREITGCPTCNPLFFGNKESWGWQAGVLGEMPLVEHLGASLRLSYSSMGVNVRQQEILAVGNEGIDKPTPIEHRINTQLGVFGLEPALTYRPLDALTLFVGMRLGIFLSAYYDNEEVVLVDTLAFKFADGTTSSKRNVRSGTIPNIASVIASAMAGVSYEIPLNRTGTVLFAPEISYNYGLNALTTDKDWRAHALRFGAALKMSPYRTIRPELTPEIQEKMRQLKRLDSIIVTERMNNAVQIARTDSLNRAITARLEEFKKFGLSVNITRVVGIGTDGKEIVKPTITVEQFHASVAHPLLAMVFFEENSAVLPSRYRRLRADERARFTFESVADKSNAVLYAHILNVVGKRMTDNPLAVLYLTGCNAGVSGETDNLKLSEQRAIAVSDYLQDVWKIAGKRLIIQKRNLPEQAPVAVAGVLPNSAAVAAENRRVELSSNMPEILTHVSMDFVKSVVTPPAVQFGIAMESGAGIKQWEFAVEQFSGTEAVSLLQRSGGKEYSLVLEWRFESEPASIPQTGQDITIQLTMTDVNNRNADTPILSIPVKQLSVEQKELNNAADKRLDMMDIIGFDAAGNLDETSLFIINRLRQTLKPKANLTILGYTDQSGDAANDKASAERRTQSVAKALQGFTAKVVTVGGTNMSDNSLAEGRFYNRFVRIQVETPVR